MNYDEMSDYKINRKVLWLTKGENRITYKNPKNEHGVLCHGIEGDFDPCNNPNDAWPIILENRISLAFGSVMATARGFTAIELHEVIDKNPLRAAMICFLKMKEAEKCHQ